MHNRKLPISSLLILRRKAVNAVIEHGFSQTKACEIFGFSKTSMSKYIREYKQDGDRSFDYEKRGVKLRTGTLLTEEQKASLIEDILSNTPDELDLSHCLLTSKVVNKYLQEKLFHYLF